MEAFTEDTNSTTEIAASTSKAKGKNNIFLTWVNLYINNYPSSYSQYEEDAGQLRGNRLYIN